MLEENEASNGMNPKSGSTVIKDNTAYIITTNVKKYLGSPRPLLLVHRHMATCRLKKNSKTSLYTIRNAHRFYENK